MGERTIRFTDSPLRSHVLLARNGAYRFGPLAKAIRRRAFESRSEVAPKHIDQERFASERFGS